MSSQKQIPFVQPTFKVIEKPEGFVSAVDRTQKSVLVLTELPVEIPREDWVDYLTQEVDIFMTTYIGYWGMGVRPLLPDGSDDETRWLVVEDTDDLGEKAVQKRVVAASSALLAGTQLPEGVHLLDEAAAIRAYVIACQRWGANWMNGGHGDANGYDVAIQLALLGEVRYG